RITKIFITHLHSDHFFGLPGLLCTLSLQSSPDPNKPPVDFCGPSGLQNFIWRSMELSHSHTYMGPMTPQKNLKFSYLNRDEVSPQRAQGRILHLDPVENSYFLVEDEQLVLKAFCLFHHIPSFGFVVEEKPRTGKLNVQKLKDLG
ncbi:Zinc phosphodiesterase ELAC protein 1, partial [Tyto alba]